MTTTTPQWEIETDDRRRTNLKMADPNTRYAVERDEDGTLHLKPMVPPMTKEQFHNAIAAAIKRSEQGKRVKVEDLDELFKSI